MLFCRFLFGIFLSLSTVYALKIDITQGRIAPTPIAVLDFFDEAGGEIGKDITKVVANDLRLSGLFEPIDPSRFVQNALSAQTKPLFDDWAAINARYLMVGRVTTSAGTVTAEFRLFDVMTGTQVLGLSFSTDKDKWRRMAHMIADEIYKHVTGEEGYFNTRIAFIEESGPIGRGRVRRLAIMDWDGFNVRYLTDGKNMVLTPRFSPNNREIACLLYQNKKASVHLFDINKERSHELGSFEGMTFAPRFSPDGESVVMSLSKGGSSAIYTMNVRSKKVTQLTQHGVIDTSPCYSHDGNQIVFTSDRGGSERCNEQIYVMDASGGEVRRISFGGGVYSQPVWSPRGDLIAFTKRINGQFYIGVMAPDGSDERLIATGFLVESPSWSANGRVVLFSREVRGKNGTRVGLCRIDLTGRGEQSFKTPREAKSGCWSESLTKSEN